MKKLLVVAAILLFFGVAFAPSINADVSKHDLETSPEENINQKEMLYQRIMELAKDAGYLDKVSDEDCGCENDNTTQWRFPVLCLFLYPLFIFSVGLFMIFDIYLPYIIMGIIGSVLNCFWLY